MKRAHRRIAGAAIGALALLASLLIALPARGETLPPVGGVVTDLDTGNPIAGACVELYNGLVLVREACTGADGRYAFDVLSAFTSVRLRATAPGHADLWAPTAPDFANATVYSLAPGPLAQDFALLSGIGTVTGQVLDPDGTAAAFATVTITNSSGTWSVKTISRIDGSYEMTGVPPGSYRVGFSRADLVSPADTAPVTVTAGASTTVNGQFTARLSAPPTTSLMRGSVTDPATLAPLGGGVQISAFNANWQEVARTTAAADGSFTVAGLVNGTYRFRGRHAGYVDQWAGASTSFGRGAPYLVPTSVTVRVFMSPGSGTIRGQILSPDGQPMRGTVSVRTAHPTLQTIVAIVATGLDGVFVFRGMPAQPYRLVVSSTGLESLDGTVDGATVFTVADGGDRTVQTRYPPRGRVELTLVDHVLGEPVAGVCASVSLINSSGVQCSTADGRVQFEGVSPRPGSVTVQDSPGYRGTTSPVSVAPGETTRLTIGLQTVGTLSIPIAPTQFGSIQDVCVYVAVERLDPQPVRQGCNLGFEPTITITDVPVGPAQLFVVPRNPEWGAQWLGSSGGTGVRELAARVWVRHGESTTAPVVRLDRAGAIAGSVQSPEALTPACALPFGRFLYDSGRASLTPCVASDTRYELSQLGPYVWPVAVFSANTAVAWSGGTSSRFSAVHVPVVAGTTAWMDIVVPPLATLTVGSISGPGTLRVYDAITGDIVSMDTVIRLPSVPVYVQFSSVSAGTCWYVGEPPYGGSGRRPILPTARKITAPATVTLTPGVNCRADAVVPIDSNPNPPKPRPLALSWGAGMDEGADAVGPTRLTGDGLPLARLAIRMAVFGRS